MVLGKFCHRGYEFSVLYDKERKVAYLEDEYFHARILSRAEVELHSKTSVTVELMKELQSMKWKDIEAIINKEFKRKYLTKDYVFIKNKKIPKS